MKSPKLPPPGWNENKLTKFLDHARDNQWATFAKKELAQTIIEIDDIFCRVIDEFQINPPDDIGPPFQLFFRAHCSYRAAASCAFAGHLAEPHPLFRSMLEQAGYAILMNGNPGLQKVWRDRDESDAHRRKVVRAFAFGKMKNMIASLDSELRDIFGTLYDRTIDFGAHPNELSVVGGMTIEKKGSEAILNFIYLHESDLVLEMTLKTLSQSGVCVLLIFREIFRDRFELLGVSPELVRLRKSL